MARPRKPDTEKRSEKITVYMTPGEKKQLEFLVEREGDKSKIVNKAIKQHIKTMQELPEPLRKAREEEVQHLNKQKVTGYVCGRGHAFFLEWEWPAQPQQCPACGNRDIRSTWEGEVNRSF